MKFYSFYFISRLTMAAEKYKLIGLIFDIIALIVSALDLTTDIVILVTWYYQGRMIFFGISLSILILAQCSYVTLFYYNHGSTANNEHAFCHSALSLLCTLPFSPILSFIFFFVADKDSCLRIVIDNFCLCFNFDWSTAGSGDSPHLTPVQNYLERKLYKHLGFLLEAMIEAFPQSILQLTALVYYNEPNAISILSILISMSSVCSKIFLLVITGNLS